MFSTAQTQYVNDLVNTNYVSGYPYYIAYTNTTVNSGIATKAQPDLYILFSDEKIEAVSGYTFNLSGNCKLYTIRTANYSTSNNAVNTDRVVVSNYTQKAIHIDSYEHIYTNAVFTETIVQPDILKEGSYQNVKIDANSVILASFLFVFCFLKMWQIHK